MAVRSVFITYRRGQAAGEARALFNDLVTVLGSDSVFMDVDTIALGRDFRQVIRERLESCDLLLALVGPGWAAVTDDAGRRRLDDANDFVRLELETALKRGIPVTPVLVQGARMPDADELPADLREFAFRNNFELSHNRWRSDVDELLKRLGIEKRATPPVASAPRSTTVRNAVLALTAIVIAAGGWFWWSSGRTGERTQEPVTSTTTTIAGIPTPSTIPPSSGGGPGQPAPKPPRPNPDTPLRALPARAFDPATVVNGGVAERASRAVLIVDERQQPDLDMTSRIASAISASDSLFKPDFVGGGLFMRVHRGDPDALKTPSLGRLQLIVLGTKRVTTEPDTATGVALVRATIDLELRLIRPSEGYATSVVPITASGGGFDQRRAIDSATDKAVGLIVQRIGAQ